MIRALWLSWQEGRRGKGSKLLPIVVFYCLILGSCGNKRSAVQVQFEASGGGKSPWVNVELAVTPGERNLGLMYRRSLGDEEGMLFIFPDNAPRSFWMKNTYLELDIIFISPDWTVVKVIERAVPLTETPRKSDLPARYVLEVNGGKAKEWGITQGSKVIVNGELP